METLLFALKFSVVAIYVAVWCAYFIFAWTDGSKKDVTGNINKFNNNNQ